MNAMRKRCLPPIIDARSRILILGTLPGEESLRLQQYYGHPRNHFWPVMSAVLGAPLPVLYEDRCALLLARGVAVWDVLGSARRAGSLDSNITDARPNALAKLLGKHPSVRHVAFNGQKAASLFRRYIARTADETFPHIAFVALPSTSPTYVRPLAEKTAAWRAALCVHLSAIEPSLQD